MSSKITLFPRTYQSPSDQNLDQNLIKEFSSEEIYELWEKLELFASREVWRLLSLHKPGFEKNMSGRELSEQITQAAAFFLRRASDRVTLSTFQKKIATEIRP